MASALDLLSSAAFLSETTQMEVVEEGLLPAAAIAGEEPQGEQATADVEALLLMGMVMKEEDRAGRSTSRDDVASRVVVPQALDDGDQTDDEDLPVSPRASNLKRPRDLTDEGDQRESIQSLLSLSTLPPLPLQFPLPFFSGPKAPPLGSFLPSLPPLPTLPTRSTQSYLPPLPPPHHVPEDSGIIRCVCTYIADDGFTIQCDTCNVWQHANCVAISPEDVPEEYRCELCDPQGAIDRGVDRKKAEEGQRRRMEVERLGMQMGEGMRRGLSANGIGNKPSRTTNDSASPAASPLASIDSTPMAGGVSGRGKKRAGKQPGQGTRGRGAAVTTASSTLPTVLAAVEAVPEAPVLTRFPSSQAVQRTNVPVSDDEDIGDEHYESWQYEYTAIEKNLWPDRRVIDRINKVLLDGPASPVLHDSKPLPVRASKDVAAAHLHQDAVIELDSHPTPAAINIKPLPSTAFQLVPPVTATYVPTSNQASTCPYPHPTVHALFATNAIASGTYIAPVRGQVVSLERYRADPLNQYSLLGIPKQGVRLLSQPWSLAIDSRMFGNEIRFARSGCHPNAAMRVLRVGAGDSEGKQVVERGSRSSTPWSDQWRGADGGMEVTFAIYATADIGRREEIVLPWDWDDQHVVHAIPSLMNSPPLPSNLDRNDLEPLSRKMAAVSNAILGTAHCACEKKRDCALFWMCKGGAAIAPVSRSAAAKREPFATVFLNALGSAKEEPATSRGKARKVKKPDVGPLLGLERGWIMKEEEIEEEVEKVEVEMDVEVEEEADAVMEEPIMEADIVAVVPASGKENVTVKAPSRTKSDAMDVDSPIPIKPTPSSSSKSANKSPSAKSSGKKRAAPIVKVDEPDSDASDLTEPLSHPSADEDEEAEEIIRPPPRRTLTNGSKRNSKDVGPLKSKVRERELEQEKARKRSEKGKGVDRLPYKKQKDSLSKDAGREKKERGDSSTPRSPPKPSLKQVPRRATVSSSDKPTKINLPGRDASLRASRSPSPNNPPTAPARLESLGGLFDGPALSYRPEPVPVTVSVTGDPSVRPTVPAPPIVAPIVVKEPTPPPPAPEPVKAPPRARLSLAAYRQLQAQKPVEVEPVVPAPAPVVVEPVPVPALVVQVKKAPDTPPTPPRPSLPILQPAFQLPRPVPEQQSRPPSTTEDVLSRIGDYFSREPSSSTIPAPARPNSYIRPAGSSTSPGLTSPQLQVVPPTSDSTRTPSLWSSSFTERTSAPTSSTSLGLALDSGVPAAREYGRKSAVYTGSSYSATKYDQPISPALYSRPIVPPPFSPTLGPGPSPTLQPVTLYPPAPSHAQSTRLSPTMRPYEPPQDIPTAPRGMPVSPSNPNRSPAFNRGYPRPSPTLAATPRALDYHAPSVSPHLSSANLPPLDSTTSAYGSPEAYRSSLPSGPRRGASTTGPATPAGRGSWPPPLSGNYPPSGGFRGTSTPRGRFEGGSGTPSSSGGPSVRGRYEGVPRGPSNMIPSRGGRGRGGPPPGWGGRGRGRGRGG